MICAIRQRAGKNEWMSFAGQVILSSGLMMGFCSAVYSDSGGIGSELIQGDAYLDQVQSQINNVNTFQLEEMMQSVPGFL